MPASDQRRRRDIRKDGGGCWARITGHGGASSGGCILKDGGHGCPTSARGTDSGHAPRVHGWGSMGANGGAKCTQNEGKMGKNAMKRGFLEPRRGSAWAYLQGIQGARASTRRVAWRLLSREKWAFFVATPA